ncbi:hypothetical protein NQD34_000099 [Periophthalmus magnuspinnatus]|nr:hypothetical protein NQD34_000099 [Periophthalmus magnuspinnatus]
MARSLCVRGHTNADSAGLTGYSSRGFPHQTIVALLQARQAGVCQGKERERRAKRSETEQRERERERERRASGKRRQQNTLGPRTLPDPFTNKKSITFVSRKLSLQKVCLIASTCPRPVMSVCRKKWRRGSKKERDFTFVERKGENTSFCGSCFTAVPLYICLKRRIDAVVPRLSRTQPVLY